MMKRAGCAWGKVTSVALAALAAAMLLAPGASATLSPTGSAGDDGSILEDEEFPDEENEADRPVEGEAYVPIEYVNHEDGEIDLDDGESGGSGTSTGSGSDSSSGNGGSGSSNAASASASTTARLTASSAVDSSNIHRLVYNYGTGYVVQVSKAARLRTDARSGGKVLAVLAKNDRLIRIGSLVKDKSGRVWVRVAAGNRRVGYVLASSLNDWRSGISSPTTIYTALMSKSVHVCDELGRIYPDAVLRKNTDVAVTEKLTLHDQDWYVLTDAYVTAKKADADLLLVPAEAVSWPDGEPEGL